MQHGVSAVGDVDALLDSDDVVGVLIASPNRFHCPQTLLAAASRKHVLVEKPMAMSVAEGQLMDFAVMPYRASGGTHRARQTDAQYRSRR